MWQCNVYVNYSTYDDKHNNNTIVNILLSIRKEQQSKIGQSLHSSYNEFQQKLIEIIDRILESITQFNEDDEIEKIIDKLQREKDTILYMKKKALDRLEILKHRLHEECIDYLLYIIGNIK